MSSARTDKLSLDHSGETPSKRLRRIWLCADDYGMSPGVSAAIRSLVMRSRLNATSVMVTAPSFNRSEAVSLAMLNIGAKRVEIGLHLVFTAPYTPLTPGYSPLRDGAFLTVGATLVRALTDRLNSGQIEAEVRAQINAFRQNFGGLPDFIDGHQHVHLFPQIRDRVLTVVKDTAPEAWIRQCGRTAPLTARLRDRKGLLLDMLSLGFRRSVIDCGIETNPGFAGTYDFTDAIAFPQRFAAFLDGLPDGGVVMCHPGFVDAELMRLDPVTTARRQEYDFFASDAFPLCLASHGVELAKPQPIQHAPEPSGQADQPSLYRPAAIRPTGVEP